MPTYHNVPPPIPSWCCCWTSWTAQAAKHVFLAPFLDVLHCFTIFYLSYQHCIVQTCNFVQRPISRCNALSLRRGTLTTWFTSHLLSFWGPSARMNQRTPKQGLTPNQKRAFFFPGRIIEGGLVMEVPIFYFHIFHSWRRVADHVMPQGIHGQKHIQKNNLAVDMPTGKNKPLHHQNGWELELLPKTEMIYIIEAWYRAQQPSPHWQRSACSAQKSAPRQIRGTGRQFMRNPLKCGKPKTFGWTPAANPCEKTQNKHSRLGAKHQFPIANAKPLNCLSENPWLWNSLFKRLQ